MANRIEQLLNDMSAKIEAVQRRLEQNDTQPETVLSRGEIAELANFTIQAFIGRIRSLLLQNLAASGIGRNTGELESGVRGAHIWCTVNRTGQIELRYGLKRGLKKDVYRYAQALHSGSVRTPMRTMNKIDLPTGRVVGKSRRSVLGEKAKRSVKAAVLGEKALSARSEAYLEKGANRAVGSLMRQKGRIVLDDGSKRVDNGKSIKVGQVVVIKPKYFFQLSDAQVATFIGEFKAKLAEYVARRLKAKEGN